MSRIPRAHEHLKTGFTAEAAAAARFRAHAEHARRQGQPALAEEWLRLAEAKDRLAIRQLEAAGQVRSQAISLGDALAEERFENEVLYPKMIAEVDPATAEVLRSVVEEQKDHADRLRRLEAALQSSRDDIEPLADSAA